MTSSIPNGFSTSELERLLKDAATETETEKVTDSQSESQRLIKLAADLCDDMMDKGEGPLLHKIVALTIMSRLSSWHQKVGTDRLKGGEEYGENWLMDAGKCEAASELLASIDLGPGDFTCRDVTEE